MGGMKSLLGDTPYQPYGGRPPYRPGNPTSKAAAESVAYVAPTVREEIYQCIARSGAHGRINNEIADETGRKLQTVCARVAELRLSGRIENSRLRRKTDTGRDAIVWRAT